MNSLRAISWILAILSVVVVAARYDALPAELPLTRWTMAAKTPLLALRVPLVNLASLALIELMTANLRRDEAARSPAARGFVGCLLGTVLAKIVIETVDLVYFQVQSPLGKYGLLAAVLVGLSGAAYFFTRFDAAQKHVLFKTGTARSVVIGFLLLAILALNLPLLWRVS